jgi:hypothetical protein
MIRGNPPLILLQIPHQKRQSGDIEAVWSKKPLSFNALGEKMSLLQTHPLPEAFWIPAGTSPCNYFTTSSRPWAGCPANAEQVIPRMSPLAG